MATENEANARGSNREGADRDSTDHLSGLLTLRLWRAKGEARTLQKQYRLTKEAEFKKLRDQGHSRANPLVVLYTLQNETNLTRVGVSASRRIGGAVVRNRVRRLIKEAVRPRLGMLKPGWDVLFIARQPIATASFHSVSSAVEQLLRRAGLLEEPPGGVGHRSAKQMGARVDITLKDSSDGSF